MKQNVKSTDWKDECTSGTGFRGKAGREEGVFWVRLVGHGADCDAARESNHDENRDSVCAPGYTTVW